MPSFFVGVPVCWGSCKHRVRYSSGGCNTGLTMGEGSWYVVWIVGVCGVGVELILS